MSGPVPELQHKLYFGFPIEDNLFTDLEAFFASNLPRQEASEALAKAVKELLDASMYVFFVKPLALLSADSGGERIVKVGVKTVKRVIKVLVGTLVYRLNDDEIHLLVQYLAGMIYRTKNLDGSNAYLATPLDEQTNEVLDEVIQRLDAGSGAEEGVKKQFRQVLLDITHDSIGVFFREPLTLLDMNPVVSKMSLKATESTEAAIQKVIMKVFDLMSVAQLQILAHYIGDLRRSNLFFEFAPEA